GTGIVVWSCRPALGTATLVAWASTLADQEKCGERPLAPDAVPPAPLASPDRIEPPGTPAPLGARATDAPPRSPEGTARANVVEAPLSTRDSRTVIATRVAERVNLARPRGRES